MKKITAASAFLMMVPFMASAQNLQGVINTAGYIINQLIPLMMAAALLVFFWGLVKYIANSGSEEGKEQGKSVMIAGIIGLFVMISIWGIVGILANTLGVQTGGSQHPPRVTAY